MLEFTEIPNHNPRAKKKTWEVYGDKILLGEVRWWEPKLVYIFHIGLGTGDRPLHSNDVDEITNFIEKQNG